MRWTIRSERSDHGIETPSRLWGHGESKNQSKNIVPSRNDPHLSIFLVKMLIPAAMKPVPVRYAQNKPPGSHAGTRLATKARKRKWSMPKTTDEAPKR
jgi:hypothetical protein